MIERDENYNVRLVTAPVSYIRMLIRIQMRKDDLVGNCTPLPCPDLVRKHWGLLQDYTRHCRAAIDLMFAHLERNLGLPAGVLANLHRIGERSGDHVRFNKKAPDSFSEARAQQGEHTDFGS